MDKDDKEYYTNPSYRSMSDEQRRNELFMQCSPEDKKGLIAAEAAWDKGTQSKQDIELVFDLYVKYGFLTEVKPA